MIERVRTWLATRTEREQRLLGVAAVAAGGAVLLIVAGAIRDDLAARRSRVAALEHELVQVRRLAATLVPAGRAASPDLPSTSTLLQTAAGAAGLGERVAAMTPATGSDGSPADDRVSLRIAGASLADTVRLLHALEGNEPSPSILRFALRKHPDDATRFDLVLEVSQHRSAP